MLSPYLMEILGKYTEDKEVEPKNQAGSLEVRQDKANSWYMPYHQALPTFYYMHHNSK